MGRINKSWHTALFALCLLWVVGYSALAAQQTDALAKRLERTSGKKEVCISSWTPMVYCDNTTDPANYTGYQVELFRHVAQELQWAPESWYFRCMDWTPMLDDLLSDSGTCYLSAAGITVDADLMDEGMMFAWPNYKQGFRVLVSGKFDFGDMWSIFRALHWQVWLGLLITSIGVCFIYFFFEKWYYHIRTLEFVKRQQKQALPQTSASAAAAAAADDDGEVDAQQADFGYAVYTNIGSLVWMEWPEPRDMPNQVVMFWYGFLLTVTITIYGANTAALLTSASLDAQVTSKDDLRGRHVGAELVDIPSLRKHNIYAQPVVWERQADEPGMLQALLAGRYEALVMDASFVLHAASTHCNLKAIGDTFDTWSLALAFPPNTNRSLIDTFSWAQVRLQERSALLDDLEQLHIDFEGPCELTPPDGLVTVHFGQVGILWVILAITIAIIAIYVAGVTLSFFYLRWRPEHPLVNVLRGLLERTHTQRKRKMERMGSRGRHGPSGSGSLLQMSLLSRMKAAITPRGADAGLHGEYARVPSGVAG